MPRNEHLIHWLFGILLALATLLSPMTVVGQSVGQDYVVGTGDSLNIQVYGEPDLSFDSLPILDEGVVVMPLIGEIRTAGKTVRDLESELTQRLADGYLIQPRVSVSVASYRPFFLVGEVRNPGTVRYVNDMNVRKAVVLGGGLTEDGDMNQVSIERSNGRVLNDVDETTPVFPGDIVTVSSRDTLAVRGAVQYPNEVAYQAGMTIDQAISLSGGFAADADRSRIMLERGGTVTDVSGALATEVRPNDIVTVNRSLSEDAAKSFFFVKGEVQRGGRYEYAAGMTVEQAIVIAGGFSDRASTRKIEIRREGDPPVTMSRVDLTTRVLPGDVITVGASLF